MRIDNISVRGLFDRFDHDIALDPSERIAIIYGPNGFGKTMILRIVNALFNSPIRSLGRMPFGEVCVDFDDGSRLDVVRDSDAPLPQVTLMDAKGERETFPPGARIGPQELPFPISEIDDFVPGLERVGPSEWFDADSGDNLELHEVLVKYEDFLPFDVESLSKWSVTPDWLKEIRTSLTVRLIDTERLTDFSSHERLHAGRRVLRYPLPTRQRMLRQARPERTVRRYSNELGRKIQQTLTDYATLSQSLDRSFPARLVKESDAQPLSTLELQEDLAKVEERRTEIVEAGLLTQEHEDLSIPDIDSIDDSRRSVLTVYAQDAKQKLSVFDDIYARTDAFLRIANERLQYKSLSVGLDGLKVANSEGSNLEPEMLSSGEQHEIVLLFELLFETKPNSLILVDEPELSLHVAWQREMLKDLQKIAELSKFRAILATHSPQIINDRWDLTIELKGPDQN